MKKCCYCEANHDFESASLCFSQLKKERNEARAEVERLKGVITGLKSANGCMSACSSALKTEVDLL